ncbi:velvet factor-domain-containing protein [Flammula alnicola]|nr:velvet factor-domain-containing protein [Flammula alnicola]
MPLAQMDHSIPQSLPSSYLTDHDDQQSAPILTGTSVMTGHYAYDRDRLIYELIVRQEPKQARMCGVGGKADRRPIDPPPIVQLRVIDPVAQQAGASNTTPSRRRRNSSTGSAPDSPTPSSSSTARPHSDEAMDAASYAHLARPDDDNELHWLKDGRTRCTTGSVVSSLYHLKDPQHNNEDAGFFVFPDLSVRTEGSYRLKLSLFEVVSNNVRHCKSIYSAPFYVYTAKKFPGWKIRIRKDIRVRKRPIPALSQPMPMNSVDLGGSTPGVGPAPGLAPVPQQQQPWPPVASMNPIIPPPPKAGQEPPANVGMHPPPGALPGPSVFDGRGGGFISFDAPIPQPQAIPQGPPLQYRDPSQPPPPQQQPPQALPPHPQQYASQPPPPPPPPQQQQQHLWHPNMDMYLTHSGSQQQQQAGMHPHYAAYAQQYDYSGLSTSAAPGASAPPADGSAAASFAPARPATASWTRDPAASAVRNPCSTTRPGTASPSTVPPPLAPHPSVAATPTYDYTSYRAPTGSPQPRPPYGHPAQAPYAQPYPMHPPPPPMQPRHNPYGPPPPYAYAYGAPPNPNPSQPEWGTPPGFGVPPGPTNPWGDAYAGQQQQAPPHQQMHHPQQPQPQHLQQQQQQQPQHPQQAPAHQQPQHQQQQQPAVRSAGADLAFCAVRVAVQCAASPLLRGGGGNHGGSSSPVLGHTGVSSSSVGGGYPVIQLRSSSRTGYSSGSSSRERERERERDELRVSGRDRDRDGDRYSGKKNPLSIGSIISDDGR